ncbi:MAG: hypothetical protein ACYC2W_12770 [Desulfurivibrionaceae bacterium]
MHIYNIIAGIMLLMFGRKLFWLFLGTAGFLIGMKITSIFFGNQPQWIQLSIAMGAGCLGAVLAILAQRFAFAFGGFFAGVYLALGAGHFLSLDTTKVLLVIAIGAGIIGAVIATLIMDTAITILACLVGAGALVGELHLGYLMNTLVFLILAGAGFLFQEKFLPATKKE